MDVTGLEPPVRGWPFLVARGRTEGYHTVLVPGVIADAPDRDTLADSVHSGSTDAGPSVETLSTSIGELTIAYRVHRLTPDDAHPAAGARGEDGLEPAADHQGQAIAVTDTFGRPLDLFYGIAVRHAVAEVDEADLRAAYDVSLPVYRRFLADERRFTPESSRAIPLRTELLPVADRAMRRPARPADPQTTTDGRRDGPDSGSSRPPDPTRRVGSVLPVALAAALLAVVAVIGWTLLRPAEPELIASDVSCDPVADGGGRSCAVELVAGGNPLPIDQLRVVTRDDASDDIEIDRPCDGLVQPNDPCVVQMNVPASIAAEAVVLVIRSGEDRHELPLRLP